MNSLETLLQSLNELIEMEVDSPEETQLVGSTGSISSSSKSGGKDSSRASARSSKKLGYATKAAALRTKLKYVDIEEAKTAELKRIKTLKELDVAEAKFNALSKLDQDIEENTHNWCQMAEMNMCMNMLKTCSWKGSFRICSCLSYYKCSQC
ncbi:hypothetical protein HOLleu_28389 [Holothuria leucospilota]|uniref:Uncharacterized protein n=1 Tax=Holothuria leucospilota TaxID=206669 RepID=A0A9Q1BM68_HOLLE|nr:hypothetical protein HOLleu_28389 [Holothuria leucospilota]